MTLSANEAAELAAHFHAVSCKVPLREIRTEAEYDSAASTLNALLDVGGADEHHPLAPLAAVLGTFIGDYDERHHASLAPPTAA